MNDLSCFQTEEVKLILPGKASQPPRLHLFTHTHCFLQVPFSNFLSDKAQRKVMEGKGLSESLGDTCSAIKNEYLVFEGRVIRGDFSFFNDSGATSNKNDDLFFVL